MERTLIGYGYVKMILGLNRSFTLTSLFASFLGLRSIGPDRYGLYGLDHKIHQIVC